MNDLLEVSLKTEAGSLMFSPVRVDKGEGVFDFNVVCALANKFSGFLPGSFACRLYRNDIEGLVSYFGSHVRGLMLGELIESPPYVPLESDIQIRALDGDVVDLSEGYFSVSIFFNCGKSNESSSNTYFGLETVVCVVDLNEFCEGLKRFILR